MNTGYKILFWFLTIGSLFTIWINGFHIALGDTEMVAVFFVVINSIVFVASATMLKRIYRPTRTQALVVQNKSMIKF